MASCQGIRRRVIGSGKAGRKVAIGSDGYPLRVHGRSVELEVAEFLLLLGVQPPLIISLLRLSLVLIRTIVVYKNGLTTCCKA